MDSVVAHNDMTVDLPPTLMGAFPNGIHQDESMDPSVEELEKELPVVYDGQISLGDLISRVVQSIYAELSEFAETMPNMSKEARKRKLADWVVHTKKQVVKLYAVAKWSRDADAVQKCMNITAFLMTQNQQFDDAIRGLNYGKESLDPARLRNHDLLTSLDVLTKGSYLRLPTCIKKLAIPPTPLTDAEIHKTLLDMEATIRYRLRMTEIIPVEMSDYRIGAEKTSGWFCTQVEFLINVGGDLTGLQEFPRTPVGIIRQHIVDEADNRLGYYYEGPISVAPSLEAPHRPRLPQGVIDTPLVRVYNFLQMMSLSYQLEILWYQAERMRSLGWADYLKFLHFFLNNLYLKVIFRRTPGRHKIPPLGGTLTISIIETHAPPQTGPGPARTSRQRVAARLQQKAKLGRAKPSDEVEGLKFSVVWEPTKGALGVIVSAEDTHLPESVLYIDADNIDFERLLRMTIQQHTKALLQTFQNQSQHGPTKVFSQPGVVTLISESTSAFPMSLQALRVQLCDEEVVIVTIDPRTGKLDLRDTGDLAAAGRGPRFRVVTDRLNENPAALFDALFTMRGSTIIDLAEQKANYLGLQVYRRRSFPKQEMEKLGPEHTWSLFIQLANFPSHYLVLVVAEERFKFALITTKPIENAPFTTMVMEDIAWLDFDRIREAAFPSAARSSRRTLNKSEDITSHNAPVDRSDKVAPSRARVAFINVERQFKLRGIPFTHVNPATSSSISPELTWIQSSLARSVPALCVQSEHILSGAPAAEAAMPNIRVIPLNWWSSDKAQVVTCVKLKYVQQPIGKKASGSAVIRPSKRIIYDTTEAVVSFLSENVNTCVDEFLEEWAKVSKMVVIAREVAQMSSHAKWRDVRLLSFDLQTVEFAYAESYTVSITCEDQLSSTGGSFNLEFSRIEPEDQNAMETDIGFDSFNPHEDAEPFFRDILRHAHGRLAPSLHYLVTLLRNTLPIVVELHKIRQDCDAKGKHVDVFAKAAGWYRLLYGDLKHGLDFRLMTSQRVAILDASHSLFDAGKQNSLVDGLGLQPIPRLREIISEAVRKGLTSGTLPVGKIAAVDVGVVCNGGSIGFLTSAIHDQILKELDSNMVL
ncbi:Mediator of RNA polymerase II transcription subunit 14 [Psilocybe cubensis]|uniref:Mediator of RNA polymerase II transcription subunit 14 n=1 Tax=Psilocybe cubensis TaxID=181762 RepID=A0ACB8HDI5_PSICU|nr:Mediator of RNA polymerase II transcription subunit 14 [Psilocybe cubensis]KAH9485239.1 Mediator of RNA polymerase II transcription subunit 14 [Psilocybe cubensis]